ncbi:pyrophosphatase PpaX [Cohnella cholangitidis]|uniref:Pyrophosphatase PpaX n=1 Tax=Cohnella cholangitidis TaxID=2598458 RepID=A0A7G5C057_9BACL|nr:pyrophosphatase PpaX [Cohnella cholangitidis]QMV42591.1 pyrophosphatase PpaX [Cohnella cholangitidis]
MTRQQKITTVLFDLDGTIIDTNELIIQSFMHALKGIVPEGFGREHIIPSMGQPLSMQLQHFSGRQDVESLTQAYREYNHVRHDEMVSLFPGVADVVARLHAAGIRMGIVTTKMRASSIRALELLGIYKYMETLVSLDDVEHAKPHPEPVAKAIQALGVKPSETFMIGDSSVDMKSAIAAGAIPVGVAWSLKGKNHLLEAGAAHILHEMTELLALCGIELEGVEG